MNGLELSKEFYEEYGKPMLENNFADLLPFLAIGFVGKGSEHFGFDDEISRDHDFEPGFCIFLPDESIVDIRQEFLLERAYSKLPKEYKGIKRLKMSPVGGNRNGVIRTAKFYEDAVGSPNGNLSTEGWLYIPDYALAEATNGEIYFDEYGEFSKIRENLMNMPQDVKLKRLAGNILIMAQSGQYNFSRCLKHNEPEASQLACVEFVNSAMKTIFLLNNKYMPFYKWSFRALKQIESDFDFVGKLSFLLLSDNHNEKINVIEEISAQIIKELQRQNITSVISEELERHAYSVNDKIGDGNLRNMHILSAI